MSRYILRRIGYLAITLLLASALIFTATQLLPGDIARVILGREAGEAALQELRAELGLDEPAPVQYVRWLGGFIRGDWGRSFSTRTEILPLVLGRLQNSLMLAGVALFLAVPLSILLGVIAGLKEDRLQDNLISLGSLSVVGLPEFVTGIVLIQIFAINLKILPANSSIPPEAGFFEALPMLILPAATASLVLLAYIVRMTRAGVVYEKHLPYVRTAELKGLPQRTVVGRHILRNGLLPTITIIAISIGWLISGLIVIENVFNYPGLGRLLIFAIDRRDIPLIQAIALVTVFIFALANLLADLTYAYLNPRIRLGR
jgi:peptide/nickel transport system permease protein